MVSKNAKIFGNNLLFTGFCSRVACPSNVILALCQLLLAFCNVFFMDPS